MNFDNFTRCDFCDRRRNCFKFLFDGRDICEGCYAEHVRPCASCNDIVIDGLAGQQCEVCTAMAGEVTL